MAIKHNKKLKFPILNDVEFVSILKNKRSVFESDGKQFEGLTWREFQLKLGEYLPPSTYYFTLKFKNNAEIHTGQIRAVSYENKTEVSMDENKILNELNSLKDKLSKAESKGGISFELLLESTKQGHAAQISYLNEKLKDRDEKIRELKNEITELDRDLTDCEKESAKSTGIQQYLQIGEKIASIYLGGKTKTPISLKESDSTDIPNEILQVLGVIDWQKIDAESIARIANSIQQYLSVIPKEFFKGV